MSNGLNLAKRPFVDTRPVTAASFVLVLAVSILSVISVRTIQRYLKDSAGTNLAITVLKQEVTETELRRQNAEAALARFDIDELGASSADANLIARQRSFSWTRFLSRIERVLPADLRVVSIALLKSSSDAKSVRIAADETVGVHLELVSRDPSGLAKTIRALYSSPFFDVPVPHQDESPEKGTAEGRRITMDVLYLDAGKRP